MKKTAIVQWRQQVRGGIDALCEGLSLLGYSVEKSSLPHNKSADLAVCWNGLRRSKWVDFSKMHGIPLLRMEMGFFDRSNNFQCDHQGILHHSSWAAARPQCNARISVAPRTSGNIVFLGQVKGDTQLFGSEADDSHTTAKAIEKASPQELPLVFRPHPLTPFARVSDRWQIDIHRGCRQQYRSHKGGGKSLQETLSNARFCIAANSNALVDATLAGIPCLAFGPAVGLMQGVYRKATFATLRDDIQAMVEGWAPSPEDVGRFIALLKLHQYSKTDLKNPLVIASILDRAGISP